MSDKKTTLIRLSDGEPEEFRKGHADGILDFQKRTGLIDYKEPDSEPTADSVPTTDNADNRPTGDSVNPDSDKRKGPKAGS